MQFELTSKFLRIILAKKKHQEALWQEVIGFHYQRLLLFVLQELTQTSIELLSRSELASRESANAI